MSRLLAAQRAFLVPAWGRDLLYRRAGAVPSLDIWPAANKTLADITTGRNLVTFTRASSATYIGSDGAMKVAAVDVPRIDHDPVTGECLGLLIEEQRTNLLLSSEEFENASWSNHGTAPTVTANAAIAPNGTLTADRITFAAADSRRAQGGLPIVSGASFTISVYALAVGSANNKFRFNFFDQSAVFNTPDITVSSSNWQRYSFTLTSTQTNNFGYLTFRNASDNAANDIYFWGAQLEAGAFPTSYIPTTASAATRSADVASITGTNFSSWYRQDEGTVFQLYSHIGAVGANNGLFNMHKTSSPTTDRHTIRAGTYTITVGNVSQATASYGIPAAGALAGIAYAYKADDIALFRPVEKTILTDNSATIPLDVNTLELGKVEETSLQLNGHIRRLTYWPRRLPNSILQTLTQ